jgi:hypothetical protein
MTEEIVLDRLLLVDGMAMNLLRQAQMLRCRVCVLSVKWENKINQLSLRSPSRVPYRTELLPRVTVCVYYCRAYYAFVPLCFMIVFLVARASGRPWDANRYV